MLRKLTVYNEVEIWMDNSSQEYIGFKTFISEFGSDETIILFYHDTLLLSPEKLQIQRSLYDSLLSIEGVDDVYCLAGLKYPLLANLPAGAGHDALKERLLSYETVKDNLLSSSAETVSYTVTLLSNRQRSEVITDIEQISLALLPEGSEFVLFGVAPLKEEVNRLSMVESKQFFISAVVIMLLISLLLFRRIIEALVPIIISVITIVISLGFLVILGIKINVVVSILPLIILVISLAYSVHFISRISDLHSRGTKTENVLETFRAIFRNCFFSALTTAIALSVFCFSRIDPISDFGKVASFGVIVSFLLSFTLLPILYFYRTAPVPVMSQRFNHFFVRTVDLISANKRIIVVIAFVLFLFSLTGVTMLRFSTDQVTYLKKDNKVRIAVKKSEEWFGAVYPIEIILKSEKPLIDDPEYISDLLKELHEKLSVLDNIRSVQSPVSVLSDLQNNMGIIIKDASALKALITDNKAIKNFLSADGKMMRITLKSPWLNDRSIEILTDEINGVMNSLELRQDINYFITGTTVLFADLSKRLVVSQVTSLLLAFILILLVFWVLFRKALFAFLFMIPNILPVLFTMGIMGFIGIPIDVATVLLASISLGIAIDDTIHFAASYYSLPGNNWADKVKSVMLSVGRPLVLTTFLLICGFSVLVFSSYRPIMFMGIFISLNVMMALIYDIILLPALLGIKTVK
ncbi:MAG: MMPL family transporter [Marinilabiliaceae bacterium]|nr:MMPL family transporter [Marinilabiliaceae bacterium]